MSIFNADTDTTNQTYSIRTRLLLWLLGPLIIIGLIALLDGYREARTTADEVSDRVLSGSALAIAERVFVNENGDLEVDIPYVALQMLNSSEDDRVFYKIEDGSGDFITGYRKLDVPELGSKSTDEISFSDGLFRDVEIRIATYRAAASSNTKSLGFTVAVAETTNARNVIAEDLLIRSAIRISALICAAAFLVWFAVTRALVPLLKLEAAVGRRSPDDIRPIEHKVPKEVFGLVVTINDLVARFADSINALKNFTSNASHQFRTPLAIIKTHLEIASREESPDAQKKAITDAQMAVGDAERLMSQMLLLARIDAASKREMESQICSLTSITKRVCEDTVLQLSNSKTLDVDLGYSGRDDVQVVGDKTLIQEVVRNLLDNALKHGGADLKIDVSVKQTENHSILEIFDSGPQFEMPRFENTASMQFKNETKKNSNGFGLSIVKDILNLFDAELTHQISPDGQGKTIKVTFVKV